VTDGVDKGSVLQAALAEFSALRSEIQARSGTGWTLVNLNLTATTAILGVVLSDKVTPRLLLALPLIAPSLGLLFIDHAYNINNIGSYIGARLRPIVTQAAGHNDLLGYEAVIDKYEGNRILRMLPLGLPLTLLFSGIPVAALVFVVPSLDAAWAWVVWAFGLSLVLLQTSLWALFMIDPRRLDPLRQA
jgi:hypothetical protein